MRALLVISAGLLIVMCAGSGCDPRASGSTGAVSSDRLSAAYETCSRTADCAGDLRCRSGVCRSAKTSAVGEYHAAAGELAMRSKRYERAIAAYTEATKAFELAKVPVPAEVHCGQGAALTRGGGDPQRYELAARVLHRCLLASPAGSAMRERALAALAELGREGLDPKLLQLEKLSDRYMTGKPAMPPVSKLDLEVSGEPAVRSHTFTRWMEKAQSEEVQQALIPCWKEHFNATRKDVMAVTLPMKHGFQLDRYGDFGRTTLEVEDLPEQGDAAADAAAACVKTAIEPIADEHTRRRQDERRWTSAFTFTLKPGK